MINSLINRGIAPKLQKSAYNPAANINDVTNNSKSTTVPLTKVSSKLCKIYFTGLTNKLFKSRTEILDRATELVKEIKSSDEDVSYDAQSSLNTLLHSTLKNEQSPIKRDDPELFGIYDSLIDYSKEVKPVNPNHKDYPAYYRRDLAMALLCALNKINPEGKNQELTTIKTKIANQERFEYKSFNYSVDQIKAVIDCTLKPEEITKLSEAFDNNGIQKATAMIQDFFVSQGKMTEKGPVNRILYNFLNKGHRSYFKPDQLKEMRLYATQKGVNIAPCLGTKGDPFYNIYTAVGEDRDLYNHLVKLKQLHLDKTINDEEYRTQVLEIYPHAEKDGILEKKNDF